MDAIAERHRDSGMAVEKQFREDLLPLNEVFRWTDGYWDFGPGVKRKMRFKTHRRTFTCSRIT